MILVTWSITGDISLISCCTRGQKFIIICVASPEAAAGIVATVGAVTVVKLSAMLTENKSL